MINWLIDTLNLDNEKTKPWYIDKVYMKLGYHDCKMGRQPCSQDADYMAGYKLMQRQRERSLDWISRLLEYYYVKNS
jgi:hypothetical protein